MHQWPALADCSSEAAVQLQARRDGPSLSSTPGSKISRQLQCMPHCPYLKYPVAISIFNLPSVWKPCFLCLRTNCAEFTARWFVWSSCWLWTSSARLENTSVHWTLRSVRDVYVIITLYKSAFLLTYFLNRPPCFNPVSLLLAAFNSDSKAKST